MAQLAQGTSVSIASLLAIPDSIALIPGSTSIVEWALKVLGIWISAAVLWFVGFLGVMHCVRFLVNGVELTESGIRLWRWARIIEWSRIEGISIEPQLSFTRIFSLSETAKRLTVFELKHARRKGHEPYLVPHHLPSFLFAASDFDQLFFSICQRQFQLSPHSANVLVARLSAFRRLRSVHKKLNVQRIVLPVIIAIGLTMLLGRKAVVNYDYNAANQEMAAMSYERARELYAAATQVDPTFAAAWNALGNAEFMLGRFEAADKDWHRALFYKPDFVEAKISLSYLRMQQRDFKGAVELVDSALNLSPMNPYALVNRADCAMRQGHVREAIEDARLVLSQDPAKTGNSRYMAACLLAQGKLRLGRAQECLRILDLQAPIDAAHTKQGCNITFRLLVTAQADLALNRCPEAKHIIDMAVRRAPRSADVIMEKARVDTELRNYPDAQEAILRARELAQNDPWPWLLQAQLHQELGKFQDARKDLFEADSKTTRDAQSLAQAAKLSLEIADLSRASELAKETLSVDPENSDALSVLGKISNQADAGNTTMQTP